MRDLTTLFLLVICMQVLHAQDDPLKEMHDAVEVLSRAPIAERFQRTIELGKAYRDADQLDSSQAVCLRALSIAASDKERMMAHYQIARTTRDLPDHELSQQHAREAILLARALGDTMVWIRSEDLLVKVALAMKRFEVAKEHNATQLGLAEATRDTVALLSLYNDMGNAHYLEGRYDSTLWYYRKCIALMREDNPQRMVMHMNMANLYIEDQRFDRALAILDTVRSELPATAMKRRSEYHNVRGYALFNMERYRDAILEFQRSDSLNKLGPNTLRLMIENTGFMAESHAALGDSGQAYLLMTDLEVLKDSLHDLASDEQMLALEKKFETRLNKEEIQRLDAENRQKEQQLRIRNLELYGSLALAVLALGAVLLVWRYLRQERRHTAVLAQLNAALKDQKERIEKINRLLQLKVLRAQMNPHFVHNSLNAIHGLVLKGAHDKAREYLQDFARLLRMVLDHSVKDLIPMSEELDFLREYLKIEALRFPEGLAWSVEAEDALLEEDQHISALLVQPFVENAIWHGLAPKQGDKRLTVRFTASAKHVVCTIEDNGVGREAERQARPDGHRSLALQITDERLQLIAHRMQEQGGYQIEDLKDDQGRASGTRVTLHLLEGGTASEQQLSLP